MSDKLKGVWVDGGVWECEDLTLIEKHFLQKIKDLDNDKGCFAMNAFFSEFFGVSKGRCSQIIKGLEKKGMIKIILHRKGKMISSRVISILNRGVKLFKHGIKNTKYGIKDIKHPYLENDQENNIELNNTINNLNESAKEKDAHILSLEEEILSLKKQLSKKEKISAKKESHEFPDITARKTYKVKVSKYNPCLTSASGGREVNQHWQDSKKLKGDYKASRGIDVEIGIIEAAKISFIEKGFNYNRYINTFEKLENSLFAWIDKQQKGFNSEPNKLSNKDFNEDGTPSYMMGLQ